MLCGNGNVNTIQYNTMAIAEERQQKSNEKQRERDKVGD